MSAASSSPRWAAVSPDDERVSFGVAALIVGLFAAPVVVSALAGSRALGEPAFGRLVVRALGGIAPLVAGAAVATLTWGNDSTTRKVAVALVAAGASPFEVARSASVRRVLASALGAAAAGAALVLGARASLHVGDARALVVDALATGWSLFLATAAWTALALATTARSGRPFVPFALVAVDVGVRALPGSLEWVGPSAHLANLLGAPPPTGIVFARALPQAASVAVLVAYACLGVALASVRFRGVRAR